MFYKLFFLLAVTMAVVLAAPKPNPAPQPQLISYSGLDYVYPADVPSIISPYSAPLAPLSYSDYPVDPYSYFVR